MPKIIEAVYENGVFKPLEKVELMEKTKAKVIIAESIERLKGKYKDIDTDMNIILDEMHDRRMHIH